MASPSPAFALHYLGVSEMAWELATTTEPKAAREHFCDQCHQTIPKGSVYSCLSGKWEGEFETFREHLECSAAMIAYNKMAGNNYDDEVINANDLEPDDLEWMEIEHPVAFLRFMKSREEQPQ